MRGKNHPIALPWLVLLLVSAGPWLYAAQPYTPELVNPLTEHWRWKHFPELEGKGVRSIAEDEEGNQWFGINTGVAKYDGYSWTFFGQADGLPASAVQVIHVSRTGDLYAATEEGIYHYTPQARWKNICRFGPLAVTLKEIEDLSDGTTILGSSIGLLQLKEGRLLRCFTNTAYRDQLAEVIKDIDWVLLPAEALSPTGTFLDVSDVLEVRPGYLWAALTLDNLGKVIGFPLQDNVRDGRLARYELIDANDGAPFGEDQKMIKARDGAIWIINTSFHIGIHTYKNNQWTYFELGNMVGGDEYAADIVETLSGDIWVGGLGKLYTFNGRQWSMYKAPEYKIPANQLIFFQGRQRKMWFCGLKSKAYLFDYSTESWLTYKNLNFQCETSRGEQWFLSVDGQAVRHRNGEWTAFEVADGLMDAPVRIIETSRGQLWAAGSHRGVAATALLENGRWQRQEHPRLSWGIDYRAVFEARDGALWFGGGVDFVESKGQLGGLLELPKPTERPLHWIHHLYHEKGLLQSNAYGIGQSPDGLIWIGGGSLYYYDGEQWQRPDTPQLRQYVNVVNSNEDLLLVGSRYYGIFTYDGRNWKQYDTNSGLVSNTIISIYGNDRNHIWAATENDISYFDGRQWVNNIFPAEMNMNIEGGMIVEGQDGTVWISKSSREWKRRALSYNKMPREARENFITYRYIPDRKPPTTSITFYTDQVAADGNTIINWEGKDYFGDTPAERLQFSYRLNGGDWSPFSYDNHHTFLNLGSGAYTFEVRARDLDFNVDPQPAVVTFSVTPPVWRQGWFIALVLAFLSIIGVLEYRIITKKQKLERLNDSLHAINKELVDKNEQIRLQNHAILKQQQQILNQTAKLEESYHNLESQNQEIQQQRDQLKVMVTQVEELSKSKLNFFTNISHELRTPLSLILGPLEQLRQNRDQVRKGEQKRLLDLVQRNAHRLLKLINQLLEIRRIEGRTQLMQYQRTDLRQFLGEIIELFHSLARAKEIELSLQTDLKTLTVAFDADKMEKIITNLLSNAFKHTPPGGRITVELKACDLEGPDARAIISVTDTGTGIPADQLDHIFDRYHSLSQDNMSSGIGLSYIKELVNLHQGVIDVHSEEGVGATFVVAIPLDLPVDSELEIISKGDKSLQTANWEVEHLHTLLVDESAGEDQAMSAQSRPRLLLVDDNEDMLTFVESMLSADYQLVKAASGEEALALAKKHAFDLIVSDVMMGEMDGLTFCRAIKSAMTTSHIPVILLTARNMEEHVMQGYATGADDYVTKPFNPQLLKIRIANLLRQRKQLHLKFNRDFALNTKEVKLTSPDEELLRKLVSLMEENISDPNFNVNKMCEMVHLSHMHFIRKVKQLTGKKPVDLLKTYRLKRAKDLLKQGKINIAEVAYMVGYDLPNSFSRAFKKEFKISPTEFMEIEEVGSDNSHLN